MSHDNAVTWKQRARLSIAQGALTNSKRPEVFVEGPTPTHASRAKGCYLFDDKGRRYIDFVCGLGTNLFGCAHKEINDAVKMQLDQGALYSLGSTLEVEFAEKIQALFPFVERIKVLKSGSDGCSAAVRIARAYTGMEGVVSEGYHGWHDDFVSLTPPAIGVPEGEHYDGNKRDWIAAYHPNWSWFANGLAAYIVEPVITDCS
jgi:glutamate-1-semialdehyde 2,1-aminomutase